jgi:N-acetylglucosaminyl-diphospho-decaprenol L-rhamnosyltransferase
VRYLDERPAVGVASPRLVHPDGRFQRAAWGFPTALALLHQYTPMSLLGIGRREARRVRREREVEDVTGPAEAVSGACLVIRRGLCDRLGGFDPAYRFYYEDVDLCWRARAEGFDVHVAADGPPVVHHGGASSALTGGAMRLPLLQGAMRFLAKRESRTTTAWFRPAFKVGVAVRALWEVVRAPAYAAVRRLRGRPERAERTLATARDRIRFLERDLLRFLRS